MDVYIFLKFIFLTALVPYEMVVYQLLFHINSNFPSPNPMMMAKKNRTLLQTRSVSDDLTNKLYSRYSLLRMYAALLRE